MDHENEQPLYVDARAMLDNKAGMMAVGIAIDLVFLVWWPTKNPFVFDPKALSEFLQSKLPARGYTEESLQKHQEELRTFFTVLPDGRWVPSPTYFSLTDGNLELRSSSKGV